MPILLFSFLSSSFILSTEFFLTSTLMVKSSILTFAVTWLLSSSVLASPTARPWDIGVAPLYEPADAETISDSYIVVLKRHVTSRQALTHCEWVGHLARQHGEPVTDFLSSEAAAGIRYTYDTPSWRGYSGKFSQKTLEDIRRSPEVIGDFYLFGI